MKEKIISSLLNTTLPTTPQPQSVVSEPDFSLIGIWTETPTMITLLRSTTQEVLVTLTALQKRIPTLT